MRTLMLVLLMSAGVIVKSQEYVASVFNLSKVGPDTAHANIKGNGVIVLDENNNHFLISVPLYSILDAGNETDSIRRIYRNIVLEFNGIFPVHNLSNYETEDDRNVYAIPGTLTINGITRPYKLDFELHKLLSSEVDPRDLWGFPARISVRMEFNPADYHLDLETARYTEIIRVNTASGVINKLDPHASRHLTKRLRSFRLWAKGLGNHTGKVKGGIKSGLKSLNFFDGLGAGTSEIKPMAIRREEN